MAEIITLHTGFHNADLHATNARLSMEGSWKKQRILYVIPGGDKIRAEVYLSHRSIVFPPNQMMVPLYIKGAEVGTAYQECLDFALRDPNLREFEFMMTIEHDNIVQPNVVIRLLTAMEKHPQYAAISALYFTKGEGGAPQCWGDIRDPVVNFRPQIPQPGQVMECYGIGMGMALWRMQMFREMDEKKVPRPWFRTVGHKPEDQGVGTQDLQFWLMARNLGYRCAVDCTTTAGHIDDWGRIW